MIKDIFIILFTFLVLDGIYFKLNKHYFNMIIKNIQGSPVQIKYISVIFTYLFMTAILYYFIIKSNRKALDALFLGIGIYGIYELTNYSTIKDWPFFMVIMDTLWGGILFSSATCMVKYVL